MNETQPVLTDDDVREWVMTHVPRGPFQGRRVLLIVPDATRTAPLPLLFDTLYRHLSGGAAALDVLVALGTHPPMSEQQICQLLGISDKERGGALATVGLFNHEWDRPESLTTLGTLTAEETRE